MIQNNLTKAILFTAFLALVGISIYGFANKGENKKDSHGLDKKEQLITDSKQAESAKKEMLKQLNKDENNNGIPDWEEELQALYKQDSEQERTTTTQDTLNSKLTQFLLESYFSQKKGEQKLQQEQIQQIAQSALEQVRQQIVEQIPQVSLEQIRTFQPTQQKLILYKSAIRKALSDLRYIDENEIVVIAKYIETKDKKLLEKIHTYGKYYETAYKNLSKVPAPEDFAREHLDLVNALAGMYYGLANFPEYDKDPLKAYALVGVITAHEKVISDIGKKMKQYFQINGVK